MIRLDVPQRGAEWRQARIGIQTMSEASRLVTPTGNATKGAAPDGYWRELLAEWATGESTGDFDAGSYWTERGAWLEVDAMSYFTLVTGLDVEQAGFAYKDESRMSGFSPDWWVLGDDGEVVAHAEVKCPSAPMHLEYLLADGCPRKYIPQVQGGMWVTGMHGYFMSYHPDFPPALYALAPDAEWQATFTKVIPAFIERLLAGRERLIEMGVTPPGGST